MQYINKLYKNSLGIFLLLSMLCSRVDAAGLFQQDSCCIRIGCETGLPKHIQETAGKLTALENNGQPSISNTAGSHQFLYVRVTSFQVITPLSTQQNFISIALLTGWAHQFTNNSLLYLKNNFLLSKHYFLSLILFPHHYFW